jgi:hypothetical protein
LVAQSPQNDSLSNTRCYPKVSEIGMPREYFKKLDKLSHANSAALQDMYEMTRPDVRRGSGLPAVYQRVRNPTHCYILFKGL